MEIDFNKPTFEREHPIVKEGGEGIQKIWRFPNGYGASAVRFSIRRLPNDSERIGSYGVNEGLWELAVLKFTGEDIKEFKLDYNTHITEDVLEHLTEAEVVKILKQIQDL